ncbi:unnamed protein product [Adineta steineri]|uniref:Uncharacterized protein n=1 Tax=Adineta steineri TaxID=433720 RepID=A0A814VKL6_9BILA|nr:unnamed protein product [Adineta steineri]CAF1436045.1 unnamed protein product [Adineta steineri]
MKQTIISILLILFVNQCVSQNGFPKQFQAILNISGLGSWDSPFPGVKQLLYDFDNLRVRFDIQGSRANQSETWMLQYKPKGAEADSSASQGYTMFNFNPDYPYFTKGEEWIPELQLNATRYDTVEICDLIHSRIGKVPCFSYFETKDRPVKTIQARPSPPESFDNDEYLTTVYLSFIRGIPSEAEHLFNLPAQWPGYCGNANAGYTIEPQNSFVVTPHNQDYFTIKLQTPPVQSSGGQVKVEFKVRPSGIYNGTQCAKFNRIIFEKNNWQIPQQVNMSFIDYGCCIYEFTANGGGYDWLYTDFSIFVFGCKERAGYDCKEKKCVE